MTSFVALLLALMVMEPEPFTRDVAIGEARKLVARERALAASALEVEVAAAATWPDASLGCPEKDHVYAQVLTDGFRVVLREGATRFDVRVTRGRAVLCGPRTAGAVAVDDLRSADKVQRLARADLAKRLGVAIEAVRVEFVRPARWPDGGLGCPKVGAAPEPRETPGFQVRLSHGERQFTYHADRERVVLCDPPTE
jgi:hypothetical protein